jgi:hypothetical protein
MLLEEPLFHNNTSDRLNSFKKPASENYFHIYDHPVHWWQQASGHHIYCHDTLHEIIKIFYYHTIW